MFEDGVINWGRVVTLLCFAYRMAITVVQRHLADFFSKIVGYLVKFVLLEKIAKWIADQGGWVSDVSDEKKIDIRYIVFNRTTVIRR